VAEEEPQIIHSRLEFTANEKGEVEVFVEAVNDMANPAVHFALWIKDNLPRLGAEARADFDKRNKTRVVVEPLKKRMLGPDGKALQ
jgi:hypothetical protein